MPGVMSMYCSTQGSVDWTAAKVLSDSEIGGWDRGCMAPTKLSTAFLQPCWYREHQRVSAGVTVLAEITFLDQVISITDMGIFSVLI